MNSAKSTEDLFFPEDQFLMPLHVMFTFFQLYYLSVEFLYIS